MLVASRRTGRAIVLPPPGRLVSGTLSFLSVARIPTEIVGRVFQSVRGSCTGQPRNAACTTGTATREIGRYHVTVGPT